MDIEHIARYMESSYGHDYFDAYEAVHTYLMLNHGGQNSSYYRMLSHSDFCGGPMWSESRVESENTAYGDVLESIEACGMEEDGV